MVTLPVRALMLIAAMIPAAVAAVPGIPEAPRPGTPPAVWVGWSNDSFGGEFGENTDDFRTNALTLGMNLERYLVAVDYSMLTDRYDDTPERTDQLTATLGYLVLDGVTAGPGAKAWLSAGGGLRLTGAMGGQEVQNAWHDALEFRRIELPDDAAAVEGVGYLHGEWMWTDVTPPGLVDLPYLRPGQMGVLLEATTLGTTGGEVLGEVGASLVLIGMDAHARIGVMQALAAGNGPNDTAQAVSENETGTWFTYGASAGGWYLEGGWNLSDEGTVGKIGWQWGRSQGRREPAQMAEVEGLLSVYQGYSLGVQYRWQPEWVTDLGGRQLALVADYRFGRYPGDGWYHNTVVTRQPLVGLDYRFFESGPGLSLSPFVTGCVGVREERVVADGANPTFGDDQAISPVVQGSVGIRVAFAPSTLKKNGPSYGFSLVYDHWLPLTGAEVTNDAGDVGEYMEANGSLGVRLNARVAW